MSTSSQPPRSETTATGKTTSTELEWDRQLALTTELLQALYLNVSGAKLGAPEPDWSTIIFVRMDEKDFWNPAKGFYYEVENDKGKKQRHKVWEDQIEPYQRIMIAYLSGQVSYEVSKVRAHSLRKQPTFEDLEQLHSAGLLSTERLRKMLDMPGRAKPLGEHLPSKEEIYQNSQIAAEKLNQALSEKQESSPTSSPSTAGTTSTSTPASKEPSSSSTSKGSLGRGNGLRPSYVYLDEITGFY